MPSRLQKGLRAEWILATSVQSTVVKGCFARLGLLIGLFCIDMPYCNLAMARSTPLEKKTRVQALRATFAGVVYLGSRRCSPAGKSGPSEGSTASCHSFEEALRVSLPERWETALQSLEAQKRTRYQDKLKQVLKAIDQGSNPKEAALDWRNQMMAELDATGTPTVTPNFKKSMALYNHSCQSCHGEGGKGKGPLADSLDIEPQGFISIAPEQRLAPYDTFNMIAAGFPSIAMPAYGLKLTDDDLWSLAHTLAALPYPEAARQQWLDLKPEVKKTLKVSGLTLALLGSKNDQELEAWLQDLRRRAGPEDQWTKDPTLLPMLRRGAAFDLTIPRSKSPGPQPR